MTTPFNDALGNVNVAPGFRTTKRTSDVELLAGEHGHTQDGCTLALGQGVLDVGTPLYRFDDGTYGKFAGDPDTQVSATSTFTDAGDLVGTPAPHNLSAGDRVKFGTVTTTTGVTAGTVYFVKSTPDDDHFTISATRTGQTVALTGNGTGGVLTEVRDSDNDANGIVGFLRTQVYTGVAGDIPKFGLRVYKGTLKYSVIKAANNGVDLTTNQLTALGARLDTNRDYLIV